MGTAKLDELRDAVERAYVMSSWVGFGAELLSWEGIRVRSAGPGTARWTRIETFRPKPLSELEYLGKLNPCFRGEMDGAGTVEVVGKAGSRTRENRRGIGRRRSQSHKGGS